MPGAYTDLTVVNGNTIQGTWGNLVRDSVVNAFASIAARGSAITAPVEGMVCYILDENIMQVYNGSAWVTLGPVAAAVATSQTTTSTSYTDLATSGPAVSLRTSTQAIVTVHSQLQNSGANFTGMSFAVSGATTLAAADLRSISLGATTGVQGRISGMFYLSALTAGVNTFTAKYAVSGGTGTYADRAISVQAIP